MVAYDALTDLDAGAPTAYLDMAGSAEIRNGLRAHLGDQLVHDAVVGVTHQEQGGGAIRDPRTSFFFAPNQMRKRTGDWGRPVLDQNFADAWHSFAPTVEGWVDVVVHDRTRSPARRVARSAVGEELTAGRERAAALTGEVPSAP